MTLDQYDVVVAVGKKSYLRRPTKEDLDFYYAWYKDPDIQRYMANPFWDPDRSKDRYREVFLRSHLLTRGDSQSLTICEAREKKPVGVVVSYDIDRGAKSCEMGILIGDPEFRGGGYATEAIELMLSYLKETVGIRIVRCSIVPQNEVSIRLFEKCGFRRSGTKREQGYDLIVFERKLE